MASSRSTSTSRASRGARHPRALGAPRGSLSQSAFSKHFNCKQEAPQAGILKRKPGYKLIVVSFKLEGCICKHTTQCWAEFYGELSDDAYKRRVQKGASECDTPPEGR